MFNISHRKSLITTSRKRHKESSIILNTRYLATHWSRWTPKGWCNLSSPHCHCHYLLTTAYSTALINSCCYCYQKPSAFSLSSELLNTPYLYFDNTTCETCSRVFIYALTHILQAFSDSLRPCVEFNYVKLFSLSYNFSYWNNFNIKWCDIW